MDRRNQRDDLAKRCEGMIETIDHMIGYLEGEQKELAMFAMFAHTEPPF